MGSLFRKKSTPQDESAGWGETEEPAFDREAILKQSRRELDAGKLDEAEQGYRKMLGANNDDVDGLRGLAAVQERKGYRQQAITTYNRLLSLDANDAEARQKLTDIMRSGV